MPETIAAPAAAPAAVSSPAPAPAPTPSPTPSATPAPVTPAVTPTETAPVTTTTETPAGAQPGAPKTEPKREDFNDGPDGNREYLSELYKFQDDQEAVQPVTEDVPIDATPAAEKTPEELAAEAAARPAVDTHEALTPEAVSALEAKTPELKQFFEEHPEVKGAFYETARKLAKAQPIADIFPNLESAQFAHTTANSTVEIRSGFLKAAEDPAQIGSAFDRFVSEFQEFDDKGQPLKNADGSPVYGKDLELLLDHATTGRIDGSIAVAKERIAGGNLSEKAKDAYQMYVDALEYAKKFESSSDIDLDRPDPEEMTPEQKSWYDKSEAELKRRQDELDAREGKSKGEAARTARQNHEVTVNRKSGEEFGSRLQEMVKADLAAGVNLPRIALETVDPNTGVSYFALAVYHKFLEATIGRQVRQPDGKTTFVGGNAKLRNDLARLEAMPPTEESAKQRIEFFSRLREEHLPGIYATEKKRIQSLDRTERNQQTTAADAARAAVQPEPRAGSAPRPQANSMDAIMERATAEVDAENKGKFISPKDRQQAINKKVWMATA